MASTTGTVMKAINTLTGFMQVVDGDDETRVVVLHDYCTLPFYGVSGLLSDRENMHIEFVSLSPVFQILDYTQF